MGGHVMVPLALVPFELVPPPEADTNNRFGGRTSWTTTFEAVEGPALVRVTVNTMLLPSKAAAGPKMAAMTSADGVTLVVTRELENEPLLLVGFGSSTGDVPDAMLMKDVT